MRIQVKRFLTRSRARYRFQRVHALSTEEVHRLFEAAVGDPLEALCILALTTGLQANGVPVYQWMDDFVNERPAWVDIVEDFVPLPKGIDPGCPAVFRSLYDAVISYLGEGGCEG